MQRFFHFRPLVAVPCVFRSLFLLFSCSKKNSTATSYLSTITDGNLACGNTLNAGIRVLRVVQRAGLIYVYVDGYYMGNWTGAIPYSVYDADNSLPTYMKLFVAAGNNDTYPMDISVHSVSFRQHLLNGEFESPFESQFSHWFFSQTIVPVEVVPEEQCGPSLFSRRIASSTICSVVTPALVAPKGSYALVRGFLLSHRPARQVLTLLFPIV